MPSTPHAPRHRSGRPGATARPRGSRWTLCVAAGALALSSMLLCVPAGASPSAPRAASVHHAGVAATTTCPRFADVADPPNIDLTGVAFLEYGLDWSLQVSGLICFNGKDAWETAPLHCDAQFSGVPGTNFGGATIDVTYCAVTYNDTPKLWQNVDVCIHFPPYWVSPSSPNAYHVVVWGRYSFTAKGQTQNPLLETGQSGLLKGASGPSCPAP